MDDRREAGRIDPVRPANVTGAALHADVPFCFHPNHEKKGSLAFSVASAEEECVLKAAFWDAAIRGTWWETLCDDDTALKSADGLMLQQSTTH